MARRKETVSQHDFWLGALRPESEERDDTNLLDESLKEAQNTISLATGSCENRMGTVNLGETAATHGEEVDLGAGRVYDVQIIPSGLKVYDSADTEVASFTANTWTSLTGVWGSPSFSDISFWVVPDPDTGTVFIGSRYFPTQALAVDSAGSWTLGALQYAQSLHGAILQPYWQYYRGTTIQPSARTGSITVTASSGIWTDAHNGQRIRYLDREIVLGTRVNSTVMNATVTEELPPTYDITVAATSGFQVGEAVEHGTQGGQGIITGISGSDITVLATSNWDQFPASGDLVGPNAKQAISAVTSVSPAASFLWDVQMLNSIQGYAGHGEKHQNRLYLCDFPGAPQAFAVSSAGILDDFTLGADDGDGFVESLGSDEGGDVLFTASAEDLIFFTTRGIYYQQTRDGTAVTPRTIGPIRFSRVGCARVRPIAVDDGAIFVDSVGEQVWAAILVGDNFRSWRARPMTTLHNHIINSPTFLGATSSGSERPEKFIYVINADGTAAVAQWDRESERISWRPWVTDGTFSAIYQAFGKPHAVVDRTINSVAKTYRERFEYGAELDAMAAVAVSSGSPGGATGTTYFGGTTALATHLNGHTAAVYMEGWDLGDRVIASGKPQDDDGNDLSYPDFEGIVQVGLPYTTRIVPWSRRSVNTQRGTRDVKRLVKLFVAVQGSRSFMVQDQTYGTYRAGEDMSQPPPARTREYAHVPGGRDFYEDIPIVQDRPGRFLLTKLRYRVTI